MSARPARGHSVEESSLRPADKHRRFHRLRHSAHLARRVLGASGRVFTSGRARSGPVRTVSAGAITKTAPRDTPSVLVASRRLPGAAVAPVNQRILSGEATLARQFRFWLVNACTIGSLTLGITAIFLAMHHQPRLGAVLLLGCVVLDGLDGALARKLGVSTAFGAQMDSLADMCSFGIATPVVAYAWLVDTTSPWVVAPVCVLVGVCAAIRLARFNVSPRSGTHFTGVPTTIAAGIIVLLPLLMPNPILVAPLALVAALALLMVSSFPYVKLGAFRRVPIVLWLVPIALWFVAPAAAFATIIGGYLLSGPVLWARDRRASVGTSGQ